MLGSDNILSKVFVDESLTCDSPVEFHLVDILLQRKEVIPCTYCGESEEKNICSYLTDEHFPLCVNCSDKGRGPMARRKSRKIKPKARKTAKPAKNVLIN